MVNQGVSQPPAPFLDCLADYSRQVSGHFDAINRLAAQGEFEGAITVMADAIKNGGVLQAFGAGHSFGFAMEVAGRAGGLIPTHPISLQSLVFGGKLPVAALNDPNLEREAATAEQLYGLYQIHPADAFLIASNSGANGATVGLALLAQADGHKVIAVTSLAHSSGVKSKHPCGKRLFEVADFVIDNQGPYGDTGIDLGGGLAVGAVSSITAAYIAQLLTIGTAIRLLDEGIQPPLYVSSNVPEGDAHNDALVERYGERVDPYSFRSGPAA
ncbi:MAG: SIS domain-containing protein [Bifidobacteriaceae bacterium]|jgi:uncharacterized phosphosugar-binding protein|nr:SIS domain-containing protein [Bifidobacteriaceae bacterium]